jgi:hypothetical protein
VALGAAGCQHDSHARAEAALLRRQIRELRTMVEDDQAGRLFPRDRLAVGVRQELLRDLLQRRLPFEAVPIPTIRVRIETAHIVLEGGQSLVELKGRVQDDTAIFADITLFGGLHLFSVDAKAGIVTARVNVERVDVWRAGAGATERTVLEGLNEGLRGPALSALSEMLPPVEMPVRLDPVLDFPGVTGAALEVPAQRLGVDVSVARVVPVNGRLWLFFDVAVRQ